MATEMREKTEVPAVTSVPVGDWGRDHWSVYAYIASRITEHKGYPDRRHMRTDPDIHPGLTHGREFPQKYPTRLRPVNNTRRELEGHDDWSCLEDMEAAGFVEWNGTGIHPCFAFTDDGWNLWHALNRHIGENPTRWSGTFNPPEKYLR